jgi:intracellular sulfur oxidation DsrE/DsrF family protein
MSNMTTSDADRPVPRRSFLSRFGAVFAATGAAISAQAVGMKAQAPAAAWQPARHGQDDWLSQIPGQHRFVFDTTTPDGFSNALLYASNYFTGNQSGYGLKDEDLALLIVARHNSTQQAYNAAMWTKYRREFAAAAGAAELPDLTERLNALLKRGVHLAVCQMATRRIAGSIAKSTGGNQDRIYDELAANLAANGHLVPAGIVAVNRAQERGYSLANA